MGTLFWPTFSIHRHTFSSLKVQLTFSFQSRCAIYFRNCLLIVNFTRLKESDDVFIATIWIMILIWGHDKTVGILSSVQASVCIRRKRNLWYVFYMSCWTCGSSWFSMQNSLRHSIMSLFLLILTITLCDTPCTITNWFRVWNSNDYDHHHRTNNYTLELMFRNFFPLFWLFVCLFNAFAASQNNDPVISWAPQNVNTSIRLNRY